MVRAEKKKCSPPALGNMCGKSVLFPAIFLTLLAGCQCILSAPPETKDITQDPNFNCRWLGGGEPKLICSCFTQDEEFYIQRKSIPVYDITAINITNCGRIRFGSQAVSEMRSLRFIELSDIKSLILEEESFNWIGYLRQNEFIVDLDQTIPSLKINIQRSHIEISRYAFKGRINKILIKDSVIEKMSPFAFSSLQQQQEIVFDGVEFKEIHPQSLKKFTTDRLIFKDCVFGVIPSRTFYDLTVKHEFRLNNITVDILRPGGFSISNPFIFEITNSEFDQLNGEGFKVVTRGEVLVRNNVFNKTGIGAFKAISVNMEETLIPQRLIFDGNVFHELSKDSLLVNKDMFVAEFSNIQVTEMCDCRNIERYFRNAEGENAQEVKCLLMDNDWVSVEEFRSQNCSIMDTTAGTVVIAVGISLIVLIILGGVLACWLKKLYRCDKYGPPEEGKNGKLSMIVPDGRTYRETELHVIVERADLLTTNL